MLAVLEGWGVGLTHCPALGQGELVEGCHSPRLYPFLLQGPLTLSAPFPGSPCLTMLRHIWKSRIMSHQLPEMLLITSMADHMEKAPPQPLHLKSPPSSLAGF